MIEEMALVKSWSIILVDVSRLRKQFVQARLSLVRYFLLKNKKFNELQCQQHQTCRDHNNGLRDNQQWYINVKCIEYRKDHLDQDKSQMLYWGKPQS